MKTYLSVKIASVLFIIFLYSSILYSQPFQVNISQDSLAEICAGEELILFAQVTGGLAPINYNWTGDVTYINSTTQPVVIFNTSVAGQYFLKVTVTDSLMNSSTDSIIINVKALPNLSSSGDTTICNGTSINLLASGANTIIWFDQLDNLIGWGSPLLVSPTFTQAYTVVGISSGCSKSREISINVIQPPVANAGNDTNICEGQSIILAEANASNFFSVEWTSSGDGTFDNPFIQYPEYFPGPNDIINGQVTLTLNVLGNFPCGNATDQLIINIFSYPVADAGIDQEICEGEDAFLIADGGTSYLWSTGENSQTINVSPSTSQYYFVTISENGCSSQDSVFVHVKPLPVINLTPDQTICYGDSVTLIATGGSFYLWNTGDTVSSLTVNPVVDTYYSVTATNNGCSSSSSVLITISNPIANAGSDQTICIGDTAFLSASGGVFFEWNTGETNQIITVHPVTSETYIVTVTDTYGCTDTAQVNIYVDSLIYSLTPETNLCNGEGVWIGVEGGSSWHWNGGENTQYIYITPSVSQQYYVTITGGACISEDSVRVNVHNELIIIHTPDTIICQGNSITLEASGGTHFLWNTGDTTSNIHVFPTETTQYTVTVTDSYCTGSAEITVDTSNPIASAGPDQTICAGESTIISANGGIYYLWSTGEISQTISVSPIHTEIYYVTVTDHFGCTATAQTQINVNELSYSITPDTSICEGQNLIIGVNGGTTWQWSGGETTQFISANPSASQNYYVTISDDQCNAEDSIMVTVHSLPQINLSNDTTICDGSNISLYVSGGLSYYWNTGDTSNIINVSPSTSTMYTVTAYNSNCFNIDSVTVNVETVFANAGVNQMICAGDTVILTATGGSTFLWNTGETTQSIAVSPSITSNYYVTVTSGNGCTASANTTVQVVNINSSIIGISEICFGDSTTLTATGGMFYIWSTGETTASINVSPDSSQTYTVTVSNVLCSNTQSINIIVHSLPEITINPDTMICSGTEVTLWASGGSDYLWNTGENTDSISVSPIVSTGYTVTVSDAFCSSSATVLVSISQFFINAGNNQLICSGDTTTLTATGAQTYVWSTGDTQQVINVSPLSNHTYTVTGTNSIGCTASTSVSVHVNSIHATITGNNTICEGSFVALTASGGLNYIWSTGETTSVIIVNPSSSQYYYVTVSNIMCNETDSIYINVNPNPLIDAGLSHYMIAGDTVLLNCNNIGTTNLLNCTWIPQTGLMTPGDCITEASPDSTTLYTLICENSFGCTNYDTVSVFVYPEGVYISVSENDTICSGEVSQLHCNIILGNQPPYSYLWSPASSLSAVDISNPLANPLNTTTYYVTVSDNVGHTAVDSVTVYVTENPEAYAGVDQTICQGETTELFASGYGEYLWSTGETTSSIQTEPLVTTEYLLTVNNHGCTDIDTVIVFVNPLPEIQIDTNKTICFGDTVMITGNSEGNWHWNTGAFSSEIYVSPTESQYYSIFSELNNCHNSDSLLITVNPIPQFVIETNLITEELLIGEWVSFEVLPDIYMSYSFFINDLLAQSGSENSFSTNILQEGDILSVIVKNMAQCQHEEIWTVKVKKIPNGFTPNQDGVNDYFMKGKSLIVFNRWGNEIYRGNEGWDGKFNNLECPAGTYFYVIELYDPENLVIGVVKGSVLLIK